jgi:hypothetical protein
MVVCSSVISVCTAGREHDFGLAEESIDSVEHDRAAVDFFVHWLSLFQGLVVCLS